MATDAGHAGRENEDFVGAVPGAVVLLDGAGIPGTEEICAHGVAWYTHRLGGVLLGRLSRGDGRGLAEILGDAIGEVADDHRGCDLADPSSPQATVAMVRARESRLEHLLLADCFVVLGATGGGVRMLTDGREVEARRVCLAALEGVAVGTPEYGRARDACVRELRARRNRAGGYWIAKDDPRAAEEAVTGSRELSGVDGVAVLSNGAARVVDPYGVTDWRGMLGLLESRGPDEVVRLVRRAEAGASGEAPDDATVAYWGAPS